MLCRWLIIITAACAAFACDRAERPSPTSSTPAPVSNTSTAAQAGGERTIPPAAATREGIEESDVQAVFDAWLAAQNTSDFDAYAALYADKFEGIKRVGPKKSSYDREGWLKDRKRMFSKKMAVAAEETQINTAGSSAIVRFTQTWASGTFKDIGPKQLVVVSSNDGLQIAREEMLNSSVVGAAAASPPPYDPTKYAFVEDGQYVVLQTSDDGVEARKPKLVSRGGAAIAGVVDTPDTANEQLGRTYVVRGGATPCRAEIESLHVLARAQPHFGQVAYWEGEDVGSGRAEPVADDQVASEVWQMTAGRGRVLVGKLDKTCTGGSWAHAESAADHVDEFLPGAKARGAIADRALKTFRKLAGYDQIQKQWSADSGKDVPWDEPGHTEITAFSAGSEVRYVAVSSSAGNGCGDFLGEFWAIFEVAGENLALMSDPAAPGAWFAADYAVVVDGEPLFSSGDRTAAKVGTVWRIAYDTSVPSFDCPC